MSFMDSIKKQGLTDEDVLTIFELARLSLSDANVYEDFAESLDLSDEYLGSLRDKVFDITSGIDFVE